MEAFRVYGNIKTSEMLCFQNLRFLVPNVIMICGGYLDSIYKFMGLFRGYLRFMSYLEIKQNNP